MIVFNCFCQTIEIPTEQGYKIAEALTRYEGLKIEFALLDKKYSLSEMELKIREQEIKLLDQKVKNLEMIIDNNKQIISIKDQQLKQKNWIKPAGIGVGVGLLIGLILAK